MTQIRPEIKTGEYQLSKHAFYAAYHFALQYPEWKDRHDALIGLSAVNNDGMPHANNVGSPTERQAIMLSELHDNMTIVEDTVRKADAELYTWLLKGVTQEQVTYNYLHLVMGMPCGKNRYYYSRRKFYYLLYKEMKVGHSGDIIA